MKETLADSLGLHCPRCRHPGESALVQWPLRLADVFLRQGEFVLEGFFACANARCAARYPILEGVPIVVKDLAAWTADAPWRPERLPCETREMRDLLEDAGAAVPANPGYRRKLAACLDNHYGPASTPGAQSADGRMPYWEAVERLLRPATAEPYARAVDLGCSVGRATFLLGDFSRLAVGLDLDFGAVARAAAFQRAGVIRYRRRLGGQREEEVGSACAPASNAVFLAADALEPPFLAESFDCVAALNMLDSVRAPLTLLGQADALLKPRGHLVLASPYEWREDVCEPAEWLETPELDGAAVVRGILAGSVVPQMQMRYELLEELPELTWPFRHHARCWTVFLTHALKARKRPPAGDPAPGCGAP